jgi:hypothetical protein
MSGVIPYQNHAPSTMPGRSASELVSARSGTHHTLGTKAQRPWHGTCPYARQGLVTADNPIRHIQRACFPEQSPDLFPGQAHILVHMLREDVEKEIERSVGTEAAVLTRIGLHHFPLLAERALLEDSSLFATPPTEKATSHRTVAGVFRPV